MSIPQNLGYFLVIKPYAHNETMRFPRCIFTAHRVTYIMYVQYFNGQNKTVGICCDNLCVQTLYMYVCYKHLKSDKKKRETYHRRAYYVFFSKYLQYFILVLGKARVLCTMYVSSVIIFGINKNNWTARFDDMNAISYAHGFVVCTAVPW